MSHHNVTIHYGKREQGWRRGEWYQTVTVTREGRESVDYRLSHYTDGRPRKIAYRGGQRGFWWWGEVRHDGRSLWNDRVDKSTGVTGILKAAGIIGDDDHIRRCGIPAQEK